MFLLIIDAHSKWMDIHCVNSATSSMTIEKLRTTFASHGLPEIAVTDNGSNFMSSEFKSFLQKNGVRHITSAPYHPSSNGLVERAVRTFKQGMKKQTDGTVETKLNRFLVSYCITPQSTTGESPGQLPWGRSLRSHLRLRTVIQETGPLSARIELEDGTVVPKHHDQVVVRPVEGSWPAVTLPSKSPVSVDSGIILPDAHPSEGTCGESPKNTEAAVSGSTTPV